MPQHYSDSRRESEPTALPNLEVFYHKHDRIRPDPFNRRECLFADDDGQCCGTGWYYWFCFSGCLPDSDPVGPFATEADALADAREGVDDE